MRLTAKNVSKLFGIEIKKRGKDNSHGGFFYVENVPDIPGSTRYLANLCKALIINHELSWTLDKLMTDKYTEIYALESYEDFANLVDNMKQLANLKAFI